MENRENLIKKMRAGKFRDNNANVLLTINILRHQYEALKDIRYALDDIDEADFLDSINFLSEEEYIKLRKISNRAPSLIEDTNYLELEAKVTAKGIRLLGGEIIDQMVEV